jgi:hypothetical protein
MAKAVCGLRVVPFAEASVSGVIRFVVFEVEDYSFAGRFDFLDVILVENGVGDYIFFGGPVAEVAVAAALAAEGEFGVFRGVGGSFADWAFVLHVRGPWFRNFCVSAGRGSLHQVTAGGNFGKTRVPAVLEARA